MKVIERKSSEAARDYAYRVIRENIISLDLKPGSMLSENEIAKHLGISRTPVREALIELSKMKIVEIIPQRGSFISKIDYNIVEEARFFRLTIETAVTELACEYASEEDIGKLEEILDLEVFYGMKYVHDKSLHYDNCFHREIYRIAKKEFIQKIVEDTTIHFDRVRRISYEGNIYEQIIADHNAILRAIKEKNKLRAIEIVTEHLTRYKLDKSIIYEKYPEYIADNNESKTQGL
ncbi:GntR family transcriptional regulator [Alkalibacter saccharofermentans]|uniref:DNA-binding transcriptional regulator, GntR family n=1 Tax=Alkalibacter saccharofermentans DSM 14828 TaxID=1120975 RepID=A0A1M4TRG3_9FIRM|nr:GntR family transcriptional regulator [Alkalibacter saccharofermentans]SHE47099.1 DNA-binding transcriptional regulator, GntR family [Alkalibacter saccharofermentans DSM 14828]